MTTCSSGKVAYSSRPAAMRVGSIVQRRKRQNVQAYRCPECRSWHNGRAFNPGGGRGR